MGGRRIRLRRSRNRDDARAYPALTIISMNAPPTPQSAPHVDGGGGSAIRLWTAAMTVMFANPSCAVPNEAMPGRATGPLSIWVVIPQRVARRWRLLI